jgi:5-methylcytosine-specific restriction endonuclease McrA
VGQDAAAAAPRKDRRLTDPAPLVLQRPDAVAAPAKPATVEPLAPLRFRVSFTASSELREKLERLQALMRSSVPDGDLVKIIDVAVSEKLERLEARRFAKTKAPRKGLAETDTTPKSRYIPAAVRRAVHERDGGRCTYRDRHGRRCTRRHDLEFHHRNPFGRGGGHSPEVLTLLCPAHHALMTEQDYGKELTARFRRSASRVSEPAARYATPLPGHSRQLTATDIGPTRRTPGDGTGHLGHPGRHQVTGADIRVTQEDTR